MTLHLLKIKVLLLLLISLIAANVVAQQPITTLNKFGLINVPDQKICYNDVLLYNLRKDPSFKAKENKMNLKIRNYLQRTNDQIITLPVVVHIVNSNPSLITDVQVTDGIKLLNDAYSKSGIYSASLGADTKIRFCLAMKEPDGGNSTGITRTTSIFGTHLNKDIADANLKNLIQWDPARYINIWIINSIDAEAYVSFICGTWYRLGVGGYATMPPSSGPLDGIVITAFGALLAHEMGHYLGLYHTFEGGCTNNDCLTDGDKVCDTPPDNSVMPSLACNNPGNSCNTDTLSKFSNGNFYKDVPDQIANFMDYGNSACSIEFTQGQADRMRAAINTQRSGLLQDECTQPCPENIVADFTRDIAYSTTGNTITFTNTSSGASNYQWLVDDVAVSTTTNFSYTFAANGKTKITLKAFNKVDCFAAYSDYIITSCGVIAAFYNNKKTIASKIGILTDSILFTNSSYNAATYQWLISNDKGMAEQTVSTSANFTYVFPVPANYKVKLVAINGACRDTSSVYNIVVADPTADGIPFNVLLNCYQSNKVRISFCLADFGFAEIPAKTPVSFYDGDPFLQGTHKLSPTYYLPYAVPGGNCYVCYSHILNVDYRNVAKIYVVLNDSGNTVPMLLPNTTFIESNYTNNIQSSQATQTTIAASICDAQNYFGHTSSGTYIDTIPSLINGCDSIRTLNLIVNPLIAVTLNITICEGRGYAGHFTAGKFIDVYTAVNGCDSTRTLYLTVKPVFKTIVTTSICMGQNYFGHTISGNYIDTLNAINGCDSIRIVNLTVKSVAHTNYNVVICNGQNYAGYSASGTYTDTFTGVNGCDSIRTVQLTVNPTFNTIVNAIICKGENYSGHIAQGTYVDIFTASNGCHSTRTLQLTVNPVKDTVVTTAICEGHNYAGHTVSGTYVDIYKTTLGCDSTRTLYLTVKPVVKTTVAITICEDDSYAGHTFSGTFVDVFTAANGCDSTRTLKLTVNQKSALVVNKIICKGESYMAGGNLQTTTGIYKDSLHNYLKCDSIITTNLVVSFSEPYLGKDRNICFGTTLILTPGYFVTYLWQDGSHLSNYPVNKVGQYAVMVSNENGCKAFDTINIIKIDTLPNNFLPSDSSLCRGNTVHINMVGYSKYLWSTGSTNSFIDITKSGNYKLDITDNNGCVGTDSLNIHYYNCSAVWIPTAFTPNADGLNELFKPTFPAPVTNYKMQVWNRWGVRVFETSNSSIGWDGRYRSDLQGTGVYIYSISFNDIDGIAEKRNGTITLVR